MVNDNDQNVQNDGISRDFCTFQKKGGIPPPRKSEKAYETAPDYGF
jgi:hypothetical protein